MEQERKEIESVATELVDGCIHVHSRLGPGLMESTYQTCLAHELGIRGLKVECEITLPLHYRGEVIETGYRIDMLINDLVLIENKSVRALLPIHQAQLLTYLRLSGCRLGFLINWNMTRIKDGIKRMANNL